MSGRVSSDRSVSRKVMIMMIRIIFRRDPVKTFHKIFFYTRKTFVYSDSCRCMLCNYIDNSFFDSAFFHNLAYVICNLDHLKFFIRTYRNFF